MAILNKDAERRSSRRRTLQEIPNVAGVSVQSQDVTVINASSGGILIECGLRLTPGTISQLEILRPDKSVRVRGRVLRCEVAGLSKEKLRYRIAIAFNTPVDFIDGDTAGESLKPDGSEPSQQESAAVFVVDASEFESALALNSW